MTASPIYLALDMPELEAARALAGRLAPYVGGLKLGLEFFAAQGPAGVLAMADLGLPVFLDLKLHDIPNTVRGAMRSLGRLRPAVVTVHAAGGPAMLEAARECAPPGTRVVAVTVLTSLDEADLRAIGIASPADEQVQRLAALARGAGLDGIVCSAFEVAAVRAAWPDALLVVPGIRVTGTEPSDQKRATGSARSGAGDASVPGPGSAPLTPADALAAGADILVVGRAITAAADPVAAARALGLAA